MALRLVVEREGAAEEYALEGAVYIGRARDNHVILDGPDVSRHHARVEVREGSLSIVDLGSANGTKVNGEDVEPRRPVALSVGDRVDIAGFVLRLLAARGAGAAIPAAAPSGAASLPEFMLEIVTAAGRMTYPLTQPVVRIGRASANDVVIPDPIVSKRHAVLRREGGSYVFEDAGSANGTFLRGELVTLRRLEHGDTLTVGKTVSLRFVSTAPVPSTEPEQAPSLIAPADHPLVVGRDATCDIILDHPSISRRHARIGPPEPDGTRLVEDLGSTNGTFVDGERLAAGEVRRALPASVIRAGPIALRFDGVSSIAEAGDRLGLKGVHLHMRVAKGVDLLQDISLVIEPREFIAVVGVSGAGKSTLVNALSGLKPATDGVVLVNGSSLYRDFDAFRTVLGYVPQDDILHRELPVAKALEYTAALRLPEDTTAEERKGRVAEVVATLGLGGREHIPVMKLSGGQRKRVSIGAELITRPGLFFLDEATSGLDPGTEGQMMRLLRQLADDGHTVVLITHATKNVMLCDKVAFLARGGHLAFYGPPDEALRHFGVEDFDGIYDLLDREGTPEEWAAHFTASSAYAAYVLPAAQMEARAEDAAPVRTKQRPRVSWLRQFGVLSRRYLDIIARDRLNLAILTFIAPVIGLIYLVAWPRDVLSFETGDASRAFVMAFLVSLLPMIIGSVSSTREIVKESAIYLRERTVSLRIGPYVASKITVAAVLGAWHALALTLFWKLGVDVPDGAFADTLNVYVTTFLVVLSGSVLGLLISSLSPREEQAVLFIIGVIIVQIVFSGGILPLGDTGVVGRVIGSVTSAYWGFRGMTAAMGIDGSGCEGEVLASCGLPGFGRFETEPERRVAINPLSDRYQDIWEPQMLLAWGAMLAIIVVMVAAIYFIQRRKDIR